MGWPGSTQNKKKRLCFLKGFSLSIFSTLCLLCLCCSLVSIYTSRQSNIKKKNLFFPLRSLSFISKFSLYCYPSLGRQNRERRELGKERCYFSDLKKISTWTDPGIPPVCKLFLISFFLPFFLYQFDWLFPITVTSFCCLIMASPGNPNQQQQGGGGIYGEEEV